MQNKTSTARPVLLGALQKGARATPRPNEELEEGLMRGLAAERDAARPDKQTESASRTISRLPYNDGALGSAADASDGRPQIKIPVADCVPNPYNPRSFYDPAGIDKLAVTLKKEGQMVAIAVTRLPEYPNKYVVIDGERRVRAKRSLDDQFILADVYPELSKAQLYEVANHINKEREEQTVFDDAVAWKKLIDDAVFGDQTGLGLALGEDPSHVAKVLALNALPGSLLQRMAANAKVVKLTHAYQLRLILKRSNIARTEELLERVIAGELPVKKLEDIAKNLEDDTFVPPRKAHYVSRNKFSRGGQEIGEMKRFDDGRMVLSLNGLTQKEQAEINGELEVLIQTFLERTASQEASDA